MGKLRFVPKVPPFKFVSISGSPDFCNASRLFQQKDAHPLTVRLGRYAVEVSPDIDWSLFDKLLDHLEGRSC